MKLIQFPEQTVIIGKDQPEYLPLPAWRLRHDPYGRIVCLWKLSWRERLKLLFSGLLWHEVLTYNKPLQPQRLTLEKPEMPKSLATQEDDKALDALAEEARAQVDKMINRVFPKS